MNDRRCDIAAKTYLIDRVLFLNGLTRSGKFLLGKLVACIDTVEYFQYVSALEHLPFLHALGLIDEAAAIALMRIGVDEHAYNYTIGRNLNFRISDASSVYNAPNFDQYVRRSLTSDTRVLLEASRANPTLPCFIVHETLPNICILYRAFPDLRIIDLQRHPIDLVSSWFLRGWGQRHAEDGLSFAPVIQGPRGGIPWFAESWRQDYDLAAPIDRVIQSIAFLVDRGEEAYANLSPSQQASMIRISYEALVEETEPTVRRLAAFLGAQVMETFAVVAAREGVPHSISAESRARKLAEIARIASPGSLEQLDRLSRRYEIGFWK